MFALKSLQESLGYSVQPQSPYGPDPKHVGTRIALAAISAGLQDGSREARGFQPTRHFFVPLNPPLILYDDPQASIAWRLGGRWKLPQVQIKESPTSIPDRKDELEKGQVPPEPLSQSITASVDGSKDSHEDVGDAGLGNGMEVDLAELQASQLFEVSESNYPGGSRQSSGIIGLWRRECCNSFGLAETGAK